MKRILAIIGIVLLFGMYVSTLIFVLMDSELAFTLFKASILLTIAVPCLIYAILLVYKAIKNRK